MDKTNELTILYDRFESSIHSRLHVGVKTLIILAIYLVQANTLYCQHGIDYYNKDIRYHGDVATVTSEYYQPIYEEDAIVGYKIEPNDFFPMHSKKYFNEEGRIILLEEFDRKCGIGIDPQCVLYHTDFTYKEGRISEEKRYLRGENPGRKRYTYKNDGDSIFYVNVMKGYQPYKTTKKKGLLLKEPYHPSKNAPTEKTTLDDKDRPIKYSKYKRDKLDQTIDFTYFEGKLDFEQIVHYISSNTIITKKVFYNDEGFMSKYENFSNKGSSSQKTLKYKYDDYNNWVEMRMYNGDGKELLKVIQTITYR